MCTQCFYSPNGSALPGAGGQNWDPLLFLNHIANGTSSCSLPSGPPAGAPPLRFLANSFYENSPGVPGDLSWFAPNMALMQASVYTL
jgi:hypothetical protein